MNPTKVTKSGVRNIALAREGINRLLKRTDATIPSQSKKKTQRGRAENPAAEKAHSCVSLDILETTSAICAQHNPDNK